MAAGYLALARGINTLWDAVNDPLFGHLSDRTRHPRGRRWPWLRAGLPVYVAAALPLWAAPAGLEGFGLFVYFLAFLLLFEASASAVYLNFNALFPALFSGDEARVRANALRRASGLLALLGATTLSPWLYSSLGFLGMGLVWAGVSAVGLGFFFSKLSEPPLPGAPAPPPFFANLLGTLRNPAFRLMLLVVALASTAQGLLLTGMPFYAKYALGLPDAQTGWLFGAVFGSALLGATVWPALTRRFGVYNCWQGALALLAVALLPLWLAEGLWAAVLVALPIGAGFSGMAVLQDVVLAQVIDRDAADTGLRREGAFYGGAALLVRLSGLVQSLIFALLTPLFGYVSGEQPGPDPESAFRFLMAGPPVVAVLLSLGVALRLRKLL